MGKQRVIRMRGGDVWGCPILGDALPFRRRKDHDLLLLTIPEFFACSAPEGGQRSPWSTRVAVLFYLATLLAHIVTAGFALVLEHSVLHHRCERLFNYWHITIWSLIFHALVFVFYCVVVNKLWFRMLAGLILMGAMAMLIWEFSVYVHMPPICHSFYHIKYSVLQNWGFYSSTFVNLFTLLIWGGYLSWIVCAPLRASGDEHEDPLISTTVFWKEDDSWTPPLFETAEVTTYKIGVNKWTKSAEQRLATLQGTLDIAGVIQKDSELQTRQMQQISELVGETEKKVSKTLDNINEQTKLIGKFRDTFEDVKVTLDTLDTKGGAGLEACTRYDACLWLVLVTLCCGGFVCLNLGLNKWADTLGLTILE